MIWAKQRKIIVAIALAVFLAANLFVVPKAQAVMGVADVTVTTTAVDVPRTFTQIAGKILGVIFQQLRRRFVTMLQNDLVNWVQGGGRPRFITNPKKFIQQAADQALVSSLDQFFIQHGKDICSSFRPQLQMLVQQASFVPEFGARCTLKDINNNLQNFSRNFNDGGWETWISLHQTQNTLPGSYLAGVQTIRAKTTTAGNTMNTQILAGKGFMDQKLCAKSTVRVGLFAPSESNRQTRAEQIYEEAKLETSFPGTDFKTQYTYTLTMEEALKQAKEEESLLTIIPQGGVSGSLYDTKTKDYTNEPGGGISMSRLGSNETCAETVTVTPGSVIGDQISGTLKSTGIDKLINAKEIAEIIDAVIDAGVNRVAREGLSLVKSGRGSYTKPARPITRLAKPTASVQGLEGVKATELLNQVVEFRTKTNTLTALMDKAAKSNNLDKFKNRLESIFSSFGWNYFCSGRKEVEAISSANRGDGTGNVIDRCAFGKGPYPVKGFPQASWPDKADFAQEGQMPGVYLANKALYEKLDKKWGVVSEFLDKQLPGKITDACKVPDVSFTLNADTDNLPFATSGGSVFFSWMGSKRKYHDEILPPRDLNPDADKDTKDTRALSTTGESWKLDLNIMAAEAQNRKIQNENLVKAYDELLIGLADQKRQVKEEKKFADDTASKIILYATVLMDYDRAGRSVNLTQTIKKYNDALNKNDDVSLEAARKLLLDKHKLTREIWERNQQATVDSLNKGLPAPTAEQLINSIDLENISSENPEIPDTFTPPVSTPPVQQTSSVSPEELTKEQNKLKIIKEAVRIINESLVPKTDEEEKASENGIILMGLPPSDAVSQAMVNLNDNAGNKFFDYGVEQITNELESRDGNVTKMQMDLANKLGKFPASGNGGAADRIQAGVDGGDSEWEKHFKLRFEYAYASMIYDFYTNHFKCQ